jgi:hypothetical protein
MRGRKAGAKYLRKAAELMNDGGKHWTRAAFRKIGRVKKDGTRSVRYCDLGGLHEVIFGRPMECDPDRFKRPAYCEAILAQARIINPHFEETCERNKTLYSYDDVTARKASLSWAESIIMSFNDRDAAGWDDVKATILSAADALEA